MVGLRRHSPFLITAQYAEAAPSAAPAFQCLGRGRLGLPAPSRLELRQQFSLHRDQAQKRQARFDHRRILRLDLDAGFVFLGVKPCRHFEPDCALADVHRLLGLLE